MMLIDNDCKQTSSVSLKRLPWVGASIAVMTIILFRASSATAAPTLDDISAAYDGHYAAIDSLRIEYEERAESLDDREVLWNHWKRYSFPDTSVSLVTGDSKDVVIGSLTNFVHGPHYWQWHISMCVLRKEKARPRIAGGDVRAKYLTCLSTKQEKPVKLS